MTTLFDWNPVVHIPLGLVCLSSLWVIQRRRSRKGLLPPGPPGYPIIGNLLELIKAERPQQLFAGWSATYGPLVRFSVLNNNVVIINSLKIANDLLEKRGAIYSDRPSMILESEIIGWNAAMPIMRYGPQFRKHRRLSQALLNANAARGYSAIHEKVTSTLLSSLARSPEKFHEHMLIYATSTIFKFTYDLDIGTTNNELVKIANDAISNSAKAYSAAGSLVDLYPSLKRLYSLPDWVPFAGARQVIASIREDVRKANGIPYDMAKERMKSGSGQPSLVQNAINSCGGIEGISAEDEKDIRGLAGILYGAGQETTMSSLNTFIMVMVRYPEVQKKAQDELDALDLGGRLPTLDDRQGLPYIEAIIKELYRFTSPLPIGVPHALISDDVYELESGKSYFIPAGTTVISNIQEMLNACPRADEFVPERFVDGVALGDVPMEPREVVFGFGRRRCPGLHVADNSVWIAIAQMLSVFEFLPTVVDGEEVVPRQEFGIEMVRHPVPFECRIVVREGRGSLI